MVVVVPVVVALPVPEVVALPDMVEQKLGCLSE